MATPGGRARAKRQAEPERTVRLGLDGQSYDVTLTRAEERQLRARLRPYVQAARAVVGPPAESEDRRAVPRLSERLRQARVQALLGVRAAAAVTGEPTQAPPVRLQALFERTAEIYAQSLAPGTRATYRRRWDHFDRWCSAHAVQSLPADAGTVMLYLAALLDDVPPPSLSTLRGRAAAVNRVHIECDLPPPGDDPALAMLMRGLSRSVPSRPPEDPVRALRIEELRQVCRTFDRPDPVVVRDAALLRLRLAGVPPGALSRLRWRDVRWRDDGIDVGTRTALNGEPSSWLRVPDNPNPALAARPALARWQAIAGPHPPLVFTLVDRQGRRDPRGLRPYGVNRVIATRLDSLGPQHGDGVAHLAAVASLLDTTASDVLRDRALLLLGFAGAFRRGELTRLVWEDVREVEEGLVVRLRRSKTDVAGRGRDVGIPWGRSLLTCPVRALLAWRQRMTDQLGEAFTEETRCFVKVGKSGRITVGEPLSEEGLTMVVKRRMGAAGLDGRWGGRSLRAGFISSAADLDLPLELIGAQSRHASLDSLIRYIRAEDPFRRNAADRVGL